MDGKGPAELKGADIVAREGLRRNLEMWVYFRRFLKISYVVLPIWLASLVIDIPMTYLELNGRLANDPARAYALIAFDAVSIAVIGAVLRALWGFRTYLRSVLRVEAGMLTISREGNDVLISLKEVVRADFNPSLFCRTFECVRLTLRDGSTHIVPRGFQRLDYVVDTIAAVQPALAQQSDWSAARRRVIGLDHAMARLNDTFKHPARVFILYSGLPLFLGLIGMYYSPWPLTFWVLFVYWVGFAIMSAVVGALIRGALEKSMFNRLQAQLATNAKELRRKMTDEERMNYWIFLIHSLVLAIPVGVWVIYVKLR